MDRAGLLAAVNGWLCDAAQDARAASLCVVFEVDGHGRNCRCERGRLNRLHGVHLESGFERACAIVGAA